MLIQDAQYMQLGIRVPYIVSIDGSHERIQFRLALGIEPGVLPGCTRSAFRIIDGLDMYPAISELPTA